MAPVARLMHKSEKERERLSKEGERASVVQKKTGHRVERLRETGNTSKRHKSRQKEVSEREESGRDREGT